MGSGWSQSDRYSVKNPVKSNFGKSESEWIASPCSKCPLFKYELFDLLTPIGKGKYGLVYLAKHKTLKRHFAVKFITKQSIHENNEIVRIQQEIKVVQKLQHPFIIHCFGGVETSHSIGLVMEYAFGGELYHRMKKDNTMSEERAKFYFCEIALALHYLHDTLRIVYRDVKPENILLDQFGHVKLCDFGFATSISLDNPIELRDGCGTAMYVAPEIASGYMKGSHGFPVDWWGLGCVLIEMITGEAPFGDSCHMSKFEIFNNITTRRVRYPWTMSRSLVELLKGLLNKDPSMRTSWLGIASSTWLQHVDWEHFRTFKIPPPWIPTLPPQPSTENFVSWNFTLPSQLPDAAVMSYCSSLVLPKTRSLPIEFRPFSVGNSIEYDGQAPEPKQLNSSPSSKSMKKMDRIDSSVNMLETTNRQLSRKDLPQRIKSKIYNAMDHDLDNIAAEPRLSGVATSLSIDTADYIIKRKLSSSNQIETNQKNLSVKLGVMEDATVWSAPTSESFSPKRLGSPAMNSSSYLRNSAARTRAFS